MTVSPVIQEFKATLDQIRQQEINRYLKNLTEEESQKGQVITKNIIQKDSEATRASTQAACQRGEAEQLSDVLRTLFNLEVRKEGAEA